MTIANARPRNAFMLAANLVLLVTLAQAACAEDASPWSGENHSSARLIAGATKQRAGVEIKLAPGWKTYWRYPGDSGTPPQFDFSASRNVKSVTVRWPAPKRLPDESGVTIGYKQNVVFPLEIVPEDPAQPVTLRLKLDYGICQKICAPADAKAELTLDGTASSHAERLASAEARVPKRVALNADGALSIRAVRREGPKIVVDIAAPEGADTALFAEGPTADWALPVPSRAADVGRLQRFTFELDGLPSGAKAAGALLTLTAVAGDLAIEVQHRLD